MPRLMALYAINFGDGRHRGKTPWLSAAVVAGLGIVLLAATIPARAEYREEWLSEKQITTLNGAGAAGSAQARQEHVAESAKTKPVAKKAHQAVSPQPDRLGELLQKEEARAQVRKRRHRSH